MTTGDATFLFLHLMKTGGTTFGAHLEDVFPSGAIYPDDRTDSRREPDWIRYGSIARLRDLPPERRAQVRVVRGHYPFLVRDVVRPDHILTILREPVDRIASALRQVQRAEGPGARTLEEIYERDPARWTIVQDYQVRQFALTWDELEEAGRTIDVLFPGREVPGDDVAHYVYVAMDDDRLERALDAIEQVDVIGLQSEYGAFLAQVRDRFGWPVHEHHRRRVATEPAPLSESLRRRIADDSAYDVEFYRRVIGSVLPRRRARR